jgi:S-adenosylmethionine:tRNA ribosyltransferase-isomerase
MKTSDFFYKLPQELIAQNPSQQRDMSRLLILDKSTGMINHKMFYNLKDLLKKDDCLVLNDTRVIPARLSGHDISTGNKMEFLLIRKVENNIWEALVKPGRRANPGNKYLIGDGLLHVEIIQKTDDGNRYISLKYDGDFMSILEKAGALPLPPYIKQELRDQERYQTVYSREKGSIAAPTAGLHFTEKLLEDINLAGIKTAFITLHVGIGTFKPVKAEFIEMHKMHREYFSINAETCLKINRTVKTGGRVIAVGTTTCRVLEAVTAENGSIEPQEGWTDIFIYPGFRFKLVDALITNFHLPCSTLIMLVSAFAGRENVLHAYDEAINNKYRFYSFGDAMLII